MQPCGTMGKKKGCHDVAGVKTALAFLVGLVPMFTNYTTSRGGTPEMDL